MSQLGVILALIFSLIIAVFAIANHQPVSINYLYGRAEVSAVVVILGSAILGALVMFLLSLIRQVRANFQIKGLRNEVEELKDNLRNLEGERDALFAQVGQLQSTAAGVETGGAGEPTQKEEVAEEGLSEAEGKDHEPLPSEDLEEAEQERPDKPEDEEK